MKIKEFDWQAGLDEGQLAAVTATLSKPVVVLAGPGSGKTLVATRRIAYMVREQGVDPEKIAAVTFSWDMSNELMTRVLQAQPDIRQENICTIHAFCNRLLKSWGDKRVKARDWRVRAAIKTVIEDRHWPAGVRTVRWWIDKAKNDGMRKEPDVLARYYTDELKTAHVSATDINYLVEAFMSVESALREDNAFTYPDLLRDAWWGLNANEGNFGSDLLAETRERFKYIVVDEGQDTLELPMKILRLISDDHLTIVGDADQLLYRFSGATPEDNLFSLDGDKAKLFKLQNNYRSRPFLVKAASDFIGANYTGKKSKFRKELTPIRAPYGDDDEIEYDEYETPEDEAKGVCDEIESFYKPGDVFVAARTNAQLAVIERELRLRQIPFIMKGDDQGLFGRSHSRDILAYLKLSIDPTDDASFERIYNIASVEMQDRTGQYSSTRWLGARFLAECKQRGAHYLPTVRTYSFTGRYADGIVDLLGFTDKLDDLTKKPPEDVIRFVIDECYERYYLSANGVSSVDPADETVLDDLDSLVELAANYSTIEEFLNFVEVMISKEKDVDKDKCVIVSTIHKLKGAERAIVFGIGWNENLLPHANALSQSAWTTVSEFNVIPIPKTGSVEDERCVAFVLITRPKDRLYLSSTKTWRGKETIPSRFLRELEVYGHIKFATKRVQK